MWQTEKLENSTKQKQKQNQQQCRRSHRIRRYSIVDNHHNHHHQQDDVDIERLRKSVRRISKNIENNDNVTDVGDDIDSLNISSSSLRKKMMQKKAVMYNNSNGWISSTK